MSILIADSLQHTRRWFYRRLGREFYGTLSQTVCKLETIRQEGWGAYRQLYAPPRGPGEQRVIQVKTCATPIHFRPATSDVTAIVQTLIRQEYGQLPGSFAPRWIVDGGGYIGDASLYYLNRYPNSRVVMVEPNPPSYAMAQLNLAPYDARVITYPMGLWSQPTRLALHDDFFTAHLVAANGQGQVECIDLISLMQIHHVDRWDLVKLDVEHAEAEIILNHSDQWLSATRVLVVEFHTTDIQERCTARLAEKGFQGFVYRELCYFINRRLME